jgi:hypothetical protein
MKERNGKRTHGTEDPKTKSSPVAPVIETPVPPQVMDPSVIPETEKKKLTDKRNKKSFKPLRQ